ncbi:MAG TPA: hypothetical protein EYN66_17095 [Myxococcales bacterium]|nr:hypothetical protein [Myxococcales bacterium]
MRRKNAIWIVLLLGIWSCKDGVRSAIPGVKDFQKPASYAQAPAKYAVNTAVPEVPQLKAPPAPAPTRAPIEIKTTPPPATPGPAMPPPKASDEVPLEPEEDPVEQEATKWLQRINEFEPGCLLAASKPNISLPSPEALAWILTNQPARFSGVAREGLVCLLDLPAVTQAEVYGTNAFRNQALAARIKLVGSAQKQGVVAMLITTDHPRAGGTFLAAMDQREGDWSIREATFLPWNHPHRGHELLAIKSARILSRHRHAVILNHRDAEHTIRQYVALTSTEEWRPLMEVPVDEQQADGTRLRARIRIVGPSWPRTIVHQATLKTPTNPVPQFSITRWTSTGENAYSPAPSLKGSITLSGARELFRMEYTAEAAWVVSTLRRKIRRSPAAYVLLAQIAAARKRFRQADKLWKRALRSQRTLPGIGRDYAIYLLSRKKTKKGMKGLKKYLLARPEAEDRADIEAMIQSYEGRP